MVLAAHAEGPKTYEGPLAKELTLTGAAQDAGSVAAAQAVLWLADPPRFRGRPVHGWGHPRRPRGVAAAHIQGGVRAAYHPPSLGP